MIARSWEMGEWEMGMLLDYAGNFVSALFSSSAHCFSPTSGILRKVKFCLPSYIGITRRNINIYFGPGGLRAPPEVAFACVAGH